MITYTDVVIVIKSNNTSTTILNELKLACRAARSIGKQDIKVNHRIFIESNVHDNTIKLIIDGNQIFIKKIDDLPQFQFFKDKKCSMRCKVCRAKESDEVIPILSADKPVILIHVNTVSTNLSNGLPLTLDVCICTLGRFEYSKLNKLINNQTIPPIKQLIYLDKTQLFNGYTDCNSKIVVDGQTLFEGNEDVIYSHNFLPNRYICNQCAITE